MARSALTVQRITRSGIVPTFESANVDGNSFTNNGKQWIHVKNSDASAHNVTVQTPATLHGLAVADLTVSVGAGSELMLGPFPQSTFGGEVLIDYASVTGMTVGAFG